VFNIIGTLSCNGRVTDKNYTYVHQQPGINLNYYRIKTVEKSGDELLSEIVRVQREKSNEMTLLRNPVVNILSVNFNVPVTGNMPFAILNLQGQELVKGTIPAGTTMFNYPLGKLAKSNYLLVVKTPGGSKQLHFVVH
jgi:hypothetical protein